MSEEPPRPVVAAATLFYCVLVAAGWVWLWLRGRTGVLGERAVAADGGAGASLIVGVAVGLGVSGALSLLTRYLPACAELERRLAAILGPLGEGEILVLALASGIGEEFFFRLAMQDALGPWWTALLFGVLHGGSRGLALWTVMALLLGLVLCWMMAAGHGLLSVTVAHALINYLSLRRMES